MQWFSYADTFHFEPMQPRFNCMLHASFVSCSNIGSIIDGPCLGGTVWN